MISLSNLLKYYRVMPAQPEHIIIDSNKRAEAILNPKTEEEEREEAERAKQEEEESARLTMEVAERVLEESKTRSMHIVEDANRKAEKIIQEANLHMAEVFDVPVGLSDHSLGSVGAVTAIALGANVIEKHNSDKI